MHYLIYFSFFLSLLFPTQVFAEDWTFAVSASNNNPSNWLGLDEGSVFFRRLTHTQPGHDWTIKIGKGGQLYSITTPQTRELISLQAPPGDWVDEVFQHVLPYPPERNASEPNISDGDIHQAGFYKATDSNLFQPIMPRSIYSPLFLFRSDPNSHSISYTTWPQHAHLPRQLADNQIFINQTIKDLGDGVIEISVEYNNWSDHDFPRTSIPWSCFRPQTVPTQIISTPNGNYIQDNRNFIGSGIVRLKDQSTGGWIALTQSNQSTSYGIGIVFGKKVFFPPESGSFLRWGESRPGAQGNELNWIATSLVREIDLAPGETFFAKYYLVIGQLKDIQTQGNHLQNQVELSKRFIPENEGITLPICTSSPVPYRRGCPSGQTPAFYLYQNFVQGSLPLFLLQNTTNNQYLLTSDPYKISFDPTDGKTKYVEFLGWAYPNELATQSSLHYRLLKSTISNRTLFPSTGADNTLTARTSSSSNPSPSVGNSADFNNDGSINLLDYNLLKAGFGTTYNLLDYNTLRSQWGQ